MRSNLFLIFFSFILYSSLNGQIPRTLSYQGVLTDSGGEILVDGQYTLAIKFYANAFGGEALWEDEYVVDLLDGIFHIIIGEQKELDLLFDKQFWIGISVDDGEELTPRTALTAAPYSLGGKATELELSSVADLKKGVIIEGKDTSIYIIPLETGIYIGPDSMANGLRNQISTRGDLVSEINAGNATISLAQLNAVAAKGPTIYASSLDGAILADGENGFGVWGVSRKSNALLGQGFASDKAAIHGTNKSFAGILGESDNGRGVYGKSINSIGVKGEGPLFGVEAIGTGIAGIGVETSGSFAGIRAKGETAAGIFEGDVRIDKLGQLKIDQVKAENSDRILVWGENKFVMFRSLSEALSDINPGAAFNGCLDNLDFKITTNKDPFFTILQGGIADLKGTLLIHDQGYGTGIEVKSSTTALFAEGLENGSAVNASAKGNGYGLYATSENSEAVLGYSTSGNGVVGQTVSSSSETTAVSGIANAGVGIYGIGDEAAGLFDGDVRIENMGQLKIDQVQGELSDNILVWADDRFVKTRSLSEALADAIAGTGFNGCLDNLDFKVTTNQAPFFTIGQNKVATLQGRLNTSNPEDKAIVGISTSSIGVQGQTETNIGVYGVSNQNGTGVYGQSSSGYGVRAISTENNGVFGTTVSGSHAGVRGFSESGRGVIGVSTMNVGLQGESTENVGVFGVSHSDKSGVLGQSEEGTGVFGTGKIGIRGVGETAGYFDGNVLIEEMGQLKIDQVQGELSDNILVWGENKFVKTRSLSEALMDLFPTDADPDPMNEIQTLTKDGPSISLSNMGGTVALLDDDAQNELQMLSKNANIISLDQNGGMIELMDDDPTNELFDGTLNDKELRVNFGGTDVFVVDNQSRVGVEGIFGANAPFDAGFPALTGVAQNNTAIFGLNNDPVFPALFVQNQNIAGPAINVVGNSFFGNGQNTFITFTPGQNQVAEFFGNLNVNGAITGTSKSFLIDHPLEPKTKQLRHFSIESDQLTNIYKGNVKLDKNGEAWVEMPDWFEALNKDFTYQLTCIGGFSNVYIAEEISDNKFKIAGEKPGLKVSWEVSGIRHDPAALDIDQSVEILKK